VGETLQKNSTEKPVIGRKIKGKKEHNVALTSIKGTSGFLPEMLIDNRWSLSNELIIGTQNNKDSSVEEKSIKIEQFKSVTMNNKFMQVYCRYTVGLTVMYMVYI